VRSSIVILAAALTATLVTTAAFSAAPNNPAALRKQCAHLVKVKLKIQDTGNVRDLAGVSGAIQMVDQCVANGGKVD
jgi:hypothetical protein